MIADPALWLALADAIADHDARHRAALTELTALAHSEDTSALPTAA